MKYFNKTQKEITQDIVNETSKNIPQVTNYNSGSVFRLFVETMAFFIFNIYNYLNELLPNIFSQTAIGTWLDEHALQLGLTRNKATFTEGLVLFERSDTANNLIISKDKIVATKANIKGHIFRYLVTEETIIPAVEVSSLVPVRAEEVGKNYNVMANQITDLVTPINGIVSINNASDWISSVGLDIESDESLRSRCLAQWEGLSGANGAAYTSWAKSIAGVDQVLTIATSRGLGTVDVIITGEGNIQPSADLLSEVQAVIDEKKPIGTDVLVKAPLEVLVDPYIHVTADEGTFADKDQISNIIHDWFSGLAIGYDFEPSELISVIFRADNIKAVDIISPNSLVISELQIARLGNLRLEIFNDSL